jgi:hypothetical protein
MSEVTGKKVSRMRGWEYLKQMEYTLKVPRAQHQESSWSEQQEWKKTWFISGSLKQLNVMIDTGTRGYGDTETRREFILSDYQNLILEIFRKSLQIVRANRRSPLQDFCPNLNT